MFRSGGNAYSGQSYADPAFTGTADQTGLNLLKGGDHVLYTSAIPFIGLSTGSVSAVGAITGITALPRAYASAYCYFPANILATVKAAGWYYCTFSTTTAGTAFLDSYTTGIPTIPSSPTAVSDGKGAFAGDTGEEFGPTVTVPAGAMGVNGELRYAVGMEFNNTAGTKTIRARFSGNAGTIFLTSAPTTQLWAIYSGRIVNRGSESVQHGVWGGLTATTVASVAPVPGAIATASGTTFVLSLQRNTATDNAILESASLEVLRGS